ncbi:MAG: exo-alpha-sialidase [Pseudomonadales bacterium]|nr:exo-alpha-sialidase [Pseudomonadales bacterium]
MFLFKVALAPGRLMSKFGFVIILGIFGSLVAEWISVPTPPSFFFESANGSLSESHNLGEKHNLSEGLSSEPSYYKVRRVSDDLTKEVHSATLVEVEDGALSAYWYGGTREGSKNTVIIHSTLERGFNWKPSRAAASREEAQQALSRYVKKLGNAVVAYDANGRLWMFYVSVSVGGWAGSAINVKYSDDMGLSWSATKRLLTSPFLNISTLVKGRPYFYDDGTIGLPVYHEFIGKFPELLHLDGNGDVIGKKRLWWGRASLQPELVATGKQTAVVFLRSADEELNRILRMETANGGSDWSTPEALSLVNPNAGIAALRRSKGGILMVFNNTPEQRNVLSLAHSRDEGKTWKVIHDFEHYNGPKPLERFSYPSIIKSSDGHYHMLYTWNRTQIKHVEFNDTWLEELL